MLIKKEHISAFLFKFYPELNPVWAQLVQKHIANTQFSHRHLRTHDYLRTHDSVSLENRKGLMFAYLEGLNLDEALKRYK